MKTIFLNGLMPDRNQTLLTALCRHFRVIGFGLQRAIEAGLPAIAAETLIASEVLPTDEQEQQRFLARLRHDYVALSSLSGVNPSFGTGHEKMALPQMRQIFTMGHLFERVAETTSIDWVVSAADYDGLRRAVVLRARSLGIPTFCIEHGYLLAGLASQCFRPGEGMFLTYASTFVNLDNDLEVAAVGRSFRPDESGQSPNFLALGTPQDSSDEGMIGQDKARERLALKPYLFTVVILGDWIEARHPGSLFNEQIENVQGYRKLFECLGMLAGRQALQVIVKVHPACASPAIFPDHRRFLARLAEQAGCPPPLFINTDLGAALAAADVLIGQSPTSVFWDGINMGKPCIWFPGETFRNRLVSDAVLRDGNILLRDEIMHAVPTRQALIDLLQRYRDPNQVEELGARITALKQTWHLSRRSAADKSEAICDFLRQNPA